MTSRKRELSSSDDDIFEYQSKRKKTVEHSKTGLNYNDQQSQREQSLQASVKQGKTPKPRKVIKKQSKKTRGRGSKLSVISDKSEEIILIDDDEDAFSPQTSKLTVLRSNPLTSPSFNFNTLTLRKSVSKLALTSTNSVCKPALTSTKSGSKSALTPTKSVSKPDHFTRLPTRFLSPHKKKEKIARRETQSKTCNCKESCEELCLVGRFTPVKLSQTLDYCPVCQAPLNGLVLQSPKWHMAECLSVERTHCGECPDGIYCLSEDLDHYRTCRHQALADARAGKTVSWSPQRRDNTTNSSDQRPTYSRQLFASSEKCKQFVVEEEDVSTRDSSRNESSTGTRKGLRRDSASDEDIFVTPDHDLVPSSTTLQGLDFNFNDISVLGGDCFDIFVPISKDVTDEPTTDVTALVSDFTAESSLKIASVRSIDHFDSSDESDIVVVSQSHGALLSPSIPTSRQQTLHSFFHLPDTIKPPQADVKPFAKRRRPTITKTQSPLPTNALPPAQRSEPETRICPFYKRIPGTKFTVDAFRYGIVDDCDAYFLSHFHSDHYAGLTKHFRHKIYCSIVTGNLLNKKLRVPDHFIHRLPMDEEVTVCGVQVTLLDANHCPGAVMFLFRLRDGRTILHTGDFRASPQMEQYPSLISARLHQLYLDTTYCSPEYAFPDQQSMIDLAVRIALRALQDNARTLFVSGTYTIGKEKIFLAVSEALDVKFCVSRDKKTILDCLGDKNLEKRMTLIWDEAQVHVLKMMQLKLPILWNHLKQHSKKYDQLVAFEPTGWTYSQKKLDLYKPKAHKNGVRIYGIPYSEHSSYDEMKRFVQFVKPDRILPTVNNGTPDARRKMTEIFDKWTKENL